MLKLTRLAIALAVAGLVSPAFAGSWPNGPTSRGDLGGFFTKTLPGLFTRPGVESQGAPAPSGVMTLAQDRAFGNEERERPALAPRRAAEVPAAKDASASRNAFTEGTGDAGWELAQHKYILTAGRFVHSQECDHALRAAQHPTPAEIEAARLASPGG